MGYASTMLEEAVELIVFGARDGSPPVGFHKFIADLLPGKLVAPGFSPIPLHSRPQSPLSAGISGIHFPTLCTMQYGSHCMFIFILPLGENRFILLLSASALV